MRKINDIFFLDWCMSFEWLKRQLKEEEKVPLICEVDFNKFDEYHTSNIYFMKPMKSFTWTINELSEKKKGLREYLKNDNRNYGDLIFSEIYDNIYFRYNENNDTDIDYKLLEKVISDADDN
jgi:hypothetical protein